MPSTITSKMLILNNKQILDQQPLFCPARTSRKMIEPHQPEKLQKYPTNEQNRNTGGICSKQTKNILFARSETPKRNKARRWTATAQTETAEKTTPRAPYPGSHQPWVEPCRLECCTSRGGFSEPNLLHSTPPQKKKSRWKLKDAIN